MRYSEKNESIRKKIFEVTKGLDPLRKDKDNPYYGSKYADHLQIWSMLKGPCEDQGLLVQHGGSLMLNGFAQKETDSGVISVPFFNVITRITDVETGEWCETDCPLAIEKPTPQGCGSAFTYGSRYGTEGIFNMAREDADDDGNRAETRKPATKTKTETRKEPPQETKKSDVKESDRPGHISTTGKDGKGRGQLGYLHVMLKKAGVSEEKAKEFIAENYEWNGKPLEHFTDLTTPELNEVLEWLEEQRKNS